MCLAIPGRILKIEDNMAQIDIGDIVTEADITLIDSPMVGDNVLLHAGFAIQKLSEADAHELRDILCEGTNA